MARKKKLIQGELAAYAATQGKHIPHKPSFPRYPGQTREEWFLIREMEIAPRRACDYCKVRIEMIGRNTILGN